MNRWIVIKKYPKAGCIESARNRPAGKAVSFIRRVIKRASRELIKTGLIILPGRQEVSPNNMNPIEYWFETNESLWDFVASYLEDNRHLLDEYPETQDAVYKMINTKKYMDQLLALTVLAALKHFFGETVHG